MTTAEEEERIMDNWIKILIWILFIIFIIALGGYFGVI